LGASIEEKIMRIRHRYCKINCFGAELEELQSILNRYAIKYDFKEDDRIFRTNSTIFYIYEDMPFFDKIRAELKSLEILSMVYTDWSKADMENAEWYQVYTGAYQYPLPDDDSGYLERTFDLTNHCPYCGIGKVQNNPFRLKHEPKQKNNQFWGLFWEQDAIFVREETKNILQRENIKGIHFIQPVLHKSNKPIERFYQLIIENTLDKGLDKSNVKEIVCQWREENDWGKDMKREVTQDYCGRVKYVFPKDDGCIFDRNLFDPKVDFYQTAEYFGDGGSALKINIISKKVYEIIQKNKLKGLIDITPIRYK
jgi:hypothetical protein